MYRKSLILVAIVVSFAEALSAEVACDWKNYVQRLNYNVKEVGSENLVEVFQKLLKDGIELEVCPEIIRSHLAFKTLLGAKEREYCGLNGIELAMNVVPLVTNAVRYGFWFSEINGPLRTNVYNFTYDCQQENVKALRELIDKRDAKEKEMIESLLNLKKGDRYTNMIPQFLGGSGLSDNDPLDMYNLIAMDIMLQTVHTNTGIAYLPLKRALKLYEDKVRAPCHVYLDTVRDIWPMIDLQTAAEDKPGNPFDRFILKRKDVDKDLNIYFIINELCRRVIVNKPYLKFYDYLNEVKKTTTIKPSFETMKGFFGRKQLPDWLSKLVEFEL